MRAPAVAAMAAAGQEAAGMSRRFVDRYVDPRAVRALASPRGRRSLPNRSAEFAAHIASDRAVALRLEGLGAQTRGLIGEVSRTALALRNAPSARSVSTVPSPGVMPPSRSSREFPSPGTTLGRTNTPRPAVSLLNPALASGLLQVPSLASPAALTPASARNVISEAARTQTGRWDGARPETSRTVLRAPQIRAAVPTWALPRATADADTRDYRRLRPTLLRDTLRRQGGAGAPLEASLRDRLRGPLRFDPSEARLHRGAVAADAARALGAQAFTIGRDVFFGEGRYEPTAPAGLELLAHELTHVGQQVRMVSDQMRFFTATGGDSLEEEAQQTAARVREMTQGGPLGASSPPPNPREIDRPAMQLARFSDGPATFGADPVMAASPAAPGALGGSRAMPNARVITDHVYELMKRELTQSRRRGQVYRKG